MRVLVTGAAGFVGSHLVALLRGERVEIFAMDLPGTRLSSAAEVTGIAADMNDREAATQVIEEVRPHRIVHLAGQPSVHRSWAEPGETLRTNVLGIVHLLDAARERDLRPAVLVVGSAEEYGLIEPDQVPITEGTPLRPNSPYAVSKVAQGALARLYGPAGGMKVVLARTFPHTGPGRGEAFAESSFARQIARIEAGLQPPVLEVGNLEAVRDYTDVRDVVRAYWGLLESGTAGAAYNVCSGRGLSIREILDALRARSTAEVAVRVDPARLRPSDIPVLVGDPSELRAATGWEPRIPLERTLADLLDDWRRRIGGGPPAGG